jgi:uncharacterized protein YggE
MQHTKCRIFTLLPFFALAIAACTPQRIQVVTPTKITATSNDDTTKFVGEGRLSHAPEYIEFAVTLRSECYPSALEASQATDKAAARVMEFLRATVDTKNPKDGVFSEGGFSQPFSRYINSNLTTCQNTFQKTTTITMKTSRIEDFSKNYDDIQAQIFSKLQAPSDTAHGRSVTFATIKVPQSRLYYETRENLEQQALADAMSSAREKFETTSKMACGIKKYRITSFSETSPDAGRPIAYERSTPSPSGQALEFQAIWINKVLEVRFKAESGDCKAG